MTDLPTPVYRDIWQAFPAHSARHSLNLSWNLKHLKHQRHIDLRDVFGCHDDLLRQNDIDEAIFVFAHNIPCQTSCTLFRICFQALGRTLSVLTHNIVFNSTCTFFLANWQLLHTIVDICARESGSTLAEGLASHQLNPLTSVTIVQGTSYVNNFIHHLLAPCCGQSTVVSPMSVDVYWELGQEL